MVGAKEDFCEVGLNLSKAVSFLQEPNFALLARNTPEQSSIPGDRIAFLEQVMSSELFSGYVLLDAVANVAGTAKAVATLIRGLDSGDLKPKIRDARAKFDACAEKCEQQRYLFEVSQQDKNAVFFLVMKVSQRRASFFERWTKEQQSSA